MTGREPRARGLQIVSTQLLHYWEYADPGRVDRLAPSFSLKSEADFISGGPDDHQFCSSFVSVQQKVSTSLSRFLSSLVSKEHDLVDTYALDCWGSNMASYSEQNLGLVWKAVLII